MRVYKSAFKLLVQSKILFSAIIVSILFVLWQMLSVRKSLIATIPLGKAMTLSLYLLIIFVLISFEYMKKLYNNGVEETILATAKGIRRKNYKACFMVMTTIAVVFSIVILIIVLIEYKNFRISDPDNEYVKHIVKCITLHIFMVMELGIVIGTSLAVFRKRIVPYVVMTMFILLSCPFATSMASTVMLSSMKSWNPGRVAFKIISNFYIVPRFDMNYIADDCFGESLLADRIFIILFWIVFFAVIVCITRKKKKIITAVVAIASVVLMFCYHSNIDKMGYGRDSFYAGDPDWIYSKTAVNKKEAAQYKILSYDMKLSMGLLLNAEVNMKVSKSLDEYKMTLFKDYIVKNVVDQKGNDLDFNQEESYITVKNKDNKKITNIIIIYSGASSDYFANYQRCFLPGYYLYYPRAGYIPVIDKTYDYVYYNFVDPDTEFNVKVKNPEKYISNLPLKNGKFSGKCDGFTLLKGFYKEKNLGNGNKLIYPYLDTFIAHKDNKTEKECWKEAFKTSIDDAKRDKLKNQMIIFDHVQSSDQGWAYGKKQIFVQIYPASY